MLTLPSSIPVSAGQRVQTLFGVGTIASFVEASARCGPCYRVKLPYGLGLLSPTAILHAVQSKASPYVRRDGHMVRDESDVEMDTSSPKVDASYKVLFGTEKMYLFWRLFSLLCSVVADCRESCKHASGDPAEKYVNPFQSTVIEPREKLNFSALWKILHGHLANSASLDAVESFSRKVCPSRVHQVMALPKIVDRCVDAMVQMADEDAVLPLYDYCQFPNVDPVALRRQCLSLVPDALYRIQYQPKSGRLWFGYWEASEILPTSPMNPNALVEGNDDDYDTNMETGDEFIPSTNMEIDMTGMNATENPPQASAAI